MIKILIGKRQQMTDILKFPPTLLEDQPKPYDTRYDKLRHSVSCGQRSKGNNSQEVCLQSFITPIHFTPTVFHCRTIK